MNAIDPSGLDDKAGIAILSRAAGAGALYRASPATNRIPEPILLRTNRTTFAQKDIGVRFADKVPVNVRVMEAYDFGLPLEHPVSVVPTKSGEYIAINTRSFYVARVINSEVFPAEIVDPKGTVPVEYAHDPQNILSRNIRDPVTNEVLYHKGATPRTWEEFAMFRARNQSGSFPLDGSKNMPRIRGRVNILTNTYYRGRGIAIRTVDRALSFATDEATAHAGLTGIWVVSSIVEYNSMASKLGDKEIGTVCAAYVTNPLLPVIDCALKDLAPIANGLNAYEREVANQQTAYINFIEWARRSGGKIGELGIRKMHGYQAARIDDFRMRGAPGLSAEERLEFDAELSGLKGSSEPEYLYNKYIRARRHEKSNP